MEPRARALIDLLRLEPHPEGGYYAELHRSTCRVMPDDGRDARAALSVIYFLLPAGQHSRWHVVRSDEQWTHLEGGAVELFVRDANGTARTTRLGPLADGASPTAVVPAGAWQAARATATFALVCCTVGPGFDFADFRLLSDDADAAHTVRTEMPHLAALL